MPGPESVPSTGNEANQAELTQHYFDILTAEDPTDLAAQETAAPTADAGESLPRYIAPPSDEQVAHAAKYGYDLNGQQKYYSDIEWDIRNKPKS